MRFMQSLHERHHCSDLCRAQILAVGRHIAPALDYLPHQLVAGQSSRNAVERRAALAAAAVQAVAIPALFALEHERTLKLERRTPFDVLDRRSFAAPRTHLRGPWRISAQVIECAEREENDDDAQHCH